MCNSSGQLSHEYELLSREIFRLAPHTGISFADVPGLRIIRRDDPSRQESILFPPCVCIASQGGKQAVIGAESYEYGCGQFLLNCVEMPSSMKIVTEDGSPYLALVMELDIHLLSQIFDEMEAAEVAGMLSSFEREKGREKAEEDEAPASVQASRSIRRMQYALKHSICPTR